MCAVRLIREARVPRRRARRDALEFLPAAVLVFFALAFDELEGADPAAAEDAVFPVEALEEPVAWEPELDWPKAGATASRAENTTAKLRSGSDRCERETTTLMHLLYVESRSGVS